MDEVDTANDKYQEWHDRRIAEIRAASDIPPGVAGECSMCGEESLRLVNSMCASCRDRVSVSFFSK